MPRRRVQRFDPRRLALSAAFTTLCCSVSMRSPAHADGADSAAVPQASQAEVKPAAQPLPTPNQAPWVTIEQTHGVTVSKRENAGGLPGFRGRGVVRGNVLRILSLLLDVDAVPRWAFGVDEARMVGRPTERADTVYLYSDVAWPVRDRDMIVRRQVEVIEPGKHFRIALTCAPDAVPERSGVVRVRECESVFELEARDDGHTHVDYAMTLEPGGYLPKWATSWVSKHVPLRTLESIESQADECGKRYEAAMRRWSAAL